MWRREIEITGSVPYNLTKRQQSEQHSTTAVHVLVARVLT